MTRNAMKELSHGLAPSVHVSSTTSEQWQDAESWRRGASLDTSLICLPRRFSLGCGDVAVGYVDNSCDGKVRFGRILTLVHVWLQL